jgi:DNA-binding NarL/FixJ family response regulator
MHMKILLVDDHWFVHEGVGAYLEANGYTVAHAYTGEEALDLIAQALPDVVVMDVSMPGAELDGIAACREIRSRYGAAPPVVIYTVASAVAEEPWRPYAEAVLAGAGGYVDKGARKEELDRAIRLVVEGRPFFDAQRIQEAMVEWSHASQREAAYRSLTRREREVFKLLQAGKTNREIAEELSIAYDTVRNHVSNILGKLGIRRRAEV